MKKLIVLALAAVLLTGCEEDFYWLKNVEVIKKQQTGGGKWVEYYVTIEKKGRKARLEVEQEDYERLMKGQYVNMKVSQNSAYVYEYTLNLGENITR